MALLGVIPARGGSKRLPGKNLMILGGKPLIAWTIEAALQSKSVNRVVVTTDSQRIADVAVAYGAEVPFLRDSRLASDSATSAETLADTLEKVSGFDHAMLLQPTSPFRTSAHIDDAYKLFSEKSPETLVSVCALHAKPDWLLEMDDTGIIRSTFEKIPRRDKVFIYNGAIYILNIEHFMLNKSFVTDTTIGYVMDEFASIDIDEPIDFKKAEFLLNQINLG